MKIGKIKRVKNMDRQFGANKEYLVGKVILDQNVFPGLHGKGTSKDGIVGVETEVAFTEWGLLRALKRASINPEDFRIIEKELKKKVSWWDRLFG